MSKTSYSKDIDYDFVIELSKLASEQKEGTMSKTVIRGCRCMGPHNIIYQLCEKCEKENEPREKTNEEVRKEFLEYLSSLVTYWANEKRKPLAKDKLDGLVFSILNIIDGTASDLPAFNLSVSPHEDDKEFNESHGENWYPSNGEHIGGEKHLHDEWSQMRNKKSGWTKTSDKLPPKKGQYLVYLADDYDDISVMMFHPEGNHSYFCGWDCVEHKPSHWMEIPNKPE